MSTSIGRTFARLAIWTLAGYAIAAGAATNAINSAPPAVNRAPATTKTDAAMQLADGVAPTRIVLEAPTAAELAPLQLSPGALQKRVPVGIGRSVPLGTETLALSLLNWQTIGGGGRAARIAITSTGAAGLRVALRANASRADVTLRFAGSGTDAEVNAPVTLQKIAAVTQGHGEWWSPILPGDTATIEIAVAAAVDVNGLQLTIAKLSHLTHIVGPNSAPGAAKTVNPGGSGKCEIDYKCEVQTPALVNAAHAVAQMTFTVANGSTFNCTGTLLNDTAASNTPYFMTAHHCIDSAYAALTLSLVWFFDSTACNSGLPGNYVQQSAGSMLLASSLSEDWALLRLFAAPPPGTVFSAWNAAPITSGPVIDLHHPRADMKKFSAGSLIPGPDNGYVDYVDDASDGSAAINAPLAQVVWALGVTEGGSSGSGLLTMNPAGFYELRGGLYGGASSCSAPSAPDVYSRMDRMLPLTRQYLAPGTMDANQTVVVEYYNKTFDRYFLTGTPDEIKVLDDQDIPGWDRTGAVFLAYVQQQPGTNPVCRFYIPGTGNSHFFSASPDECAAILHFSTTPSDPHYPTYSGFIYESPNAFYIALPNTTTGACPSGTHPLWRFVNVNTTDHRYTADLSVRDNLRNAAGWIPEGYGTDATIMCSPNGS